MARKIKDENGRTYVQKKPFYKRFWFWVLVLIVIFGVGSQLGGDSSSENAASSDSSTTKTDSQSLTVTKDSSSKSNVPTEYTSALNKAKTYAKTMNMSKQGVYEQLTADAGEQFSAEAGQYAIDHLTDIDWNANALAKAKSYQDDMDMSPDAISDQLTSEAGEQFTPDEAAYAVQHLND